jgi:transposase-like protein
MTPNVTHPDDDRVYACPECDRAGNMWRREGRQYDADERYRCHDCGAEFGDPVERTTHDKLPSNLSDDAKQKLRQLRSDHE